MAALCLAALFAWTVSLASAGAGNHAGTASHATIAHDSSGGRPFSGDSLGGLVLLMVIVFVVRHYLRRANGAVPANVVNPSPARSVPSAIDAIRTLDPGFELECFLQRAEMTFFLVKRGMQKNDAAAIRPFLNDAVFATVSQSLAQSKSQHRHELLESLNIRGIAIEDAVCSTGEQQLLVHFDLVYRAKTLDDSNRIVNDEGEDRRHAERWTFTRKADARTTLNGGVIAAKCPACGAELRLSLAGICAHCKASVTNGTVDWVVADVRPAAFLGYSANSSLGVAAASVAEGLATLAAADPAFEIGAFEARVRTAFLALQDAWCKQKLDAGRAFMSPGAYFSWSSQLESMAGEGRRNVMEHLEIQRIEPVAVIHGRVYDDLTVRISAAAADFDVDATGNIVFGDRSVRPFREDWTFQRSVGVTSSNKPGTLENTCPSCGAPVSLTQLGECRYCKAAVTSGKFDWVLSRIDQEDSVATETGSLDDISRQLAIQVGGAVVGGLISSVLSDGRPGPGIGRAS